MAKKLPWLRLHTEIVDDPKLASFGGDEFRVWVYLLCMARESSAPGTIGMDAHGIAWRLRQPAELVERTLVKCEQGGMVRRDANTVTVCNWAARQYEKPSDTPKETRKRQRKSRDKGVTKASCHAAVTPALCTESDTETETDTEKQEAGQVAIPAAPVAPVVAIVAAEEWPRGLRWIPPVVERVFSRFPTTFGSRHDFLQPARWRSLEAEVDSWGHGLNQRFADELETVLSEFQGYWTQRKRKRTDAWRTFRSNVRRWHDRNLGAALRQKQQPRRLQ